VLLLLLTLSLLDVSKCCRTTAAAAVPVPAANPVHPCCMASIKRQPNASTAAQPCAAGTVTAARKEQVTIWCYVTIEMRQNICHIC
jgi:hypothetical protein